MTLEIDTSIALVLPLKTSTCKLLVTPRLAISTLLVPSFKILPRCMILSQVAADPVNLTTDTIVRPPLVAMFKVREPASRYCDLLRSKLT